MGHIWTWRRRRTPRILLSFGASCLFYGAWDWRFTSLLAISTVVDYTAGRRLEVTDDHRSRKQILLVSLCVNLGILGIFKYLGFFVDSAAELLDALGFSVSVPVLHIVLPVGISFHTFQTMSYTIDVYQRRIAPTHDFIAFAMNQPGTDEITRRLTAWIDEEADLGEHSGCQGRLLAPLPRGVQ